MPSAGAASVPKARAQAAPGQGAGPVQVQHEPLPVRLRPCCAPGGKPFYLILFGAWVLSGSMPRRLSMTDTTDMCCFSIKITTSGSTRAECKHFTGLQPATLDDAESPAHRHRYRHAHVLELPSQVEAAVKGQANWLFQLVGDAHTVLSNPQSRRDIDRDLAFAERPSSRPRAKARNDHFPYAQTYGGTSFSFR